MGIHADYPDICEGIRTEQKIFPERTTFSEIHADPSLIIDSFTITPDILSDHNEKFTVTAKTKIDPDMIESIYYLHPAYPMMKELEYDPEKNIWLDTSDSGTRSSNIFCNSTIFAWIRTKNGGIGPKAECKITIRYGSDE